MIYEWSFTSNPGRMYFYDETTGEEVRYVKYYDTETFELRRLDADGDGTIRKINGLPCIIHQQRRLLVSRVQIEIHHC
jgi:hypothetical protein